MAAIGSAVGLGNIWRFSYVTYENGGAAFLVPYIIAIIVAGLPLMVLEYAFGHKERGASPLAFNRVNKKLEWVGWWMPTVATIGIQLFYAVVMAWCIRYFMFSFTLAWGTDTGSFFFKEFLHISDGPFKFEGFRWDILVSTMLVWIICWLICYREVNHGIEKACSIFMPMLFILTTILVCWSVTLDGAMDGIKAYIVDFNWDKVTSKTWISAFGQIFFTLSLGFGIMITYASYLPKKINIRKSAYITTICNCGYSIFAGLAVFATLGFMANAKGVPIAEVVKGGPSLAFVTYPEAINQLPFGNKVFGALFFFTLIIAGLSSGISLIEAFVCSITDKFNFKRGKVVTWVCVLGFFGSIIFTTNAGLYVLDIVDHFVNQYGLLVGGVIECVVIGWVVKAKVIQKHINSTGEGSITTAWNFLIKFVTPVILITAIIYAIYNDVTKGYENYSITALTVYGILFITMTIIIAVILAILPWKKEPHEHDVEEDHLLV